MMTFPDQLLCNVHSHPTGNDLLCFITTPESSDFFHKVSSEVVPRAMVK